MSTESNSNKTTIPAPYVFSPAQTWEGNDGSWSTFYVRVGTPSQNFRVLVSTAANSLVIPHPQGCGNDYAECGPLRGVTPFNNANSNGFQVNESSTWESIGLFNLGLEEGLGYVNNSGLFGFDTVGLQIQNSGGLDNITHQLVSAYATKDFYHGFVGLDPRPANFSTFDDPQPSFMHSLRSQDLIPSMAFGYTAGAPYRFQKVLGNLVLGGYDKSRLVSNDIVFPFGPNDSRYFSLNVQNILATDTLSGTVTLLKQGILSFIDSTVPHIWLPPEVCDQFERAFGLIYDDNTELYLVNNTIRSRLLELNPSVTFKLGAQNVGGQTLNIVLPYAAFDLQATHPIYENSTNYFPIRRAKKDDSTQYVLGRTFLQEAYLVSDYERSTFTVSQARFENPMPQQEIVPIISPSYGNLTSNSTDTSNANSTTTENSAKKPSESLTGGEKAGIGIGAAISAILILALMFLIHKRGQRRLRAAKTTSNEAEPGLSHENAAELENPERHEAPGGEDVMKFEMEAKEEHHEMQGEEELHEMYTPQKVAELDSGNDGFGERGYFYPINQEPVELPAHEPDDKPSVPTIMVDPGTLSNSTVASLLQRSASRGNDTS